MKPLSYLIGADDQPEGSSSRIVEVGYDHDLPAGGDAIGYCNLLDEKNEGRLGPYLEASGTAAEYREGLINPRGAGWGRNLHEQLDRRKRQGFRLIEWDNPDSYPGNYVMEAISLTETYGMKVVAKNPMLMEDTKVSYVQHPVVVGAIVEFECGDPAGMDDLRRKAGKPNLPVWFVAFGKPDQFAWINKIAQQAGSFQNMGATFSRGGEYVNVNDVLVPR